MQVLKKSNLKANCDLDDWTEFLRNNAAGCCQKQKYEKISEKKMSTIVEVRLKVREYELRHDNLGEKTKKLDPNIRPSLQIHSEKLEKLKRTDIE